jgi:hypothetical protein
VRHVVFDLTAIKSATLSGVSVRPVNSVYLRIRGTHGSVARGKRGQAKPGIEALSGEAMTAWRTSALTNAFVPATATMSSPKEQTMSTESNLSGVLKNGDGRSQTPSPVTPSRPPSRRVSPVSIIDRATFTWPG